MMYTIQEIEQAVSQLSRDELTRFRDWFDEFDAVVWDKQFENDVYSGRLDPLANQAIADFRAGKYKESPPGAEAPGYTATPDESG